MEKSILLHCISPEELNQLIKEVLKDELIDLKKNLDLQASDLLLTRSETCEFLKIDSSTTLELDQERKNFLLWYRCETVL